MQTISGLIYLFIYAVLALTIWAPINAIRRPESRYPGKMSKASWVTLLILTLSAQALTTLVWAFPFLSGFVTVFFYLFLVVLPGRRGHPRDA